MLAHAISSTKPTAPRSATSAGRTCSTTSLCMPATTIWRSWVLWNWWTSRRRAARRSISSWPCSRVTPSLTRVTTVSQAACRSKSPILLGRMPQASIFAGMPASGGR